MQTGLHRTDICQHRLWSQERLSIHQDTVEGRQDTRGHTPADALRVPPLCLTNTKPGKRQAASDTRFQIKERCGESFLGRFHTKRKATPFLENPRQAHVLTRQLFL